MQSRVLLASSLAPGSGNDPASKLRPIIIKCTSTFPLASAQVHEHTGAGVAYTNTQTMIIIIIVLILKLRARIWHSGRALVQHIRRRPWVPMSNIKNGKFFKCLLTLRIFILNPWREPAKQKPAWGKVINWSRMICKMGTFIAGTVIHTIPWAWGQSGLQRLYLQDRLSWDSQADLQDTEASFGYHRDHLQCHLHWKNTNKKKKKRLEPRTSSSHTNPADLHQATSNLF